MYKTGVEKKRAMRCGGGEWTTSSAKSGFQREAKTRGAYMHWKDLIYAVTPSQSGNVDVIERQVPHKCNESKNARLSIAEPTFP